MALHGEIQPLCDALLIGLQRILGEKLYALYLFGAVAFPETTHTGDIDFHVLLEEPLAAEEIGAVRALHDELAGRFPPFGAELDGYYLLLEEARGNTLPRHQLHPDLVDDAWALHCAHIHAERCIVLCGPAPATVYPEPKPAAIVEALAGELRYVKEHLAQYPDYCVLNLCRLMYSHRTRDIVVSKSAAAAWAVEAFPQWRELIDTATASYAGATTDEDRRRMLKQVPGLYRFAADEIERCSFAR